VRLRIITFVISFIATPALARAQAPQASPIYTNAGSLDVMPVKPPAMYQGLLNAFSTCIAGAPMLSKPSPPIPSGSAASVKVDLLTPLSKGDTVCVTEHYTYAGAAPAPTPAPSDVATKLLTAVDPPVDSISAGIPIISQSYTQDKTVWVVPASMGASYKATVTAYSTCTAGAPVLSGAQNVAAGSTAPIAIPLAAALAKGASVCVVQKYIYSGPLPAPANPPSDSASKNQVTIDRLPGAPYSPSSQTALALSRVTGGIEVSSSASVDPAARFILDGAFDFPFSNRDNSLYNTFWGSGYVRLGSIAQPGAVSGVADVGTYIKPLVDSTPNHLVQSVEANFAGEAAFAHFNRNLGALNSFSKVAFQANAGFISPLSTMQANPTIYVVSQAIYNYYTTAASTNALTAAANAAIVGACGSTFDSTKPCYLANLPQDRTRFFRDYALGFVYKKYYYNGGSTKDNDSFLFPGIASVSIGQNEYVTRGQLRGFVLHADATWPLPSTLSGRFAGGVYVFGSVDTNVSDRNASTQQFLLPTAGSTITLTSSNVAQIPVAQANRDRYRFGITVDLVKLITAVGAAVNNK
jgi:hypothetical protein